MGAQISEQAIGGFPALVLNGGTNSSFQLQLSGTTYATFNSGNFYPASDNAFTLGGASLAFADIYSHAYFAGSTAGVTCATGSPTSSFAAIKGIVTHC